MNKDKISQVFKEIKTLNDQTDKDLSAIEKSEEEYISLRRSLLLNPTLELQDRVGELETYLDNSQLKELDILLNISQNLIGFSISLLIAFISIPALDSNSIYPLIVFIFSSLFLVLLVYKRRQLVFKINSKSLNRKVEIADNILSDIKRNIPFVEKKLDKRGGQIKAMRVKTKRATSLITSLKPIFEKKGNS